MWSSELLSFTFFCGLVAGHAVRAACGVSSAYSVLASVSTGSAFCSSLLYPTGPSVVTTTVSTTSTKTCKTVTTTETDTKIKTVYKTKSTELPSITIYSYSSTVLIPSGSHLPVNKRAPQGSVASSSTSPTTTSTAVAASLANVSAQGQQQCSPTPSGICGCPSQTVSAACSSLVPSPSRVTSTTTAISSVKCPKTEVTVTTTLKGDKVTSTTTQTNTPPPFVVTKTGVLTTSVPAACAGGPYLPSGSGDANGDGDEIFFPFYPYYPRSIVECCVVCYHPDVYLNCVASAYIPDSAECQLLIKVNSTSGSTSPQCPLGIENYDFGPPEATGNILPGPCGY